MTLGRADWPAYSIWLIYQQPEVAEVTLHRVTETEMELDERGEATNSFQFQVDYNIFSEALSVDRRYDKNET